MADEIIQKRSYMLDEYIQLLFGEDGYESPTGIWLSVDSELWPEAKKIALIEFMYALNSTRYYLNDGVPYADETEVLSTIPIENRLPYMTVNIDGVEYWFDETLTSLSNKVGTLSLLNASVTLAKMASVASGSVFYRKSSGVGPPEVNSLATLKQDLGLAGTNSGDQNIPTVYPITLSAGNVAARVAAAIEITNYPEGWVLTANGNDLIITHNLNKELISATIKKVNGTKRILRPFSTAYSGIEETSMDELVIEGLAGGQDAFDILILLYFSN